MSALAEIQAKLEAMSPEKYAELAKTVMQATADVKWTPNEGIQTDAYYSEADILWYGGAAGGGKSDLELGLAFNQHKKSMVVRQQYTDLQPLIDRAIEINGTKNGFNGSPPPRLTISEGHQIDFVGVKDLAGIKNTQGKARDLLCIDEAVQIPEAVIRLLMGWVRTTDPNQRCRVVLASNPPLSDEGLWITTMFAPWIDPNHPNPAKSGELRWYVSDEYGDDVCVEGAGVYEFNEDGLPVPSELHEDDDNAYTATSRTFIPARLKDNPALMSTGYKKTLDNMPEPYRSALRDGKIWGARQDHQLQLIPSEWVQAAMDRWTRKPPNSAPQCCLGVDIAQGGNDDTVIAPRHDFWFAPMLVEKGRDTPTGRDVAGLIMKHRLNGSHIVLDMGGGYGGATLEQLEQVIDKKYLIQHKGSHKGIGKTEGGSLPFYNRRAELFYRLREALDPSQAGGSDLMLPNDPQLFGQLCSIRIDKKSMDSHVIRLEPKVDLVKRIGTSPDKADAVSMAWSAGAKTQDSYSIWKQHTDSIHNNPKVVTSKRMRNRR